MRRLKIRKSGSTPPRRQASEAAEQIVDYLDRNGRLEPERNGDP